MNTASVEKIANAVLYEGYLLYPYRLDSLKNRQRWSFGTLYPPQPGATAGPNSFHAEFLVRLPVHGGRPASLKPPAPEMLTLEALILETRIRFLQFTGGQPDGSPAVDEALWNEVVERQLDLPEAKPGDSPCAFEQNFAFPPERIEIGGKPHWTRELKGIARLNATAVSPDSFRVALEVANASSSAAAGREETLLHSFASAHAILQLRGGDFISLLEPAADLDEAAAQCRNEGVFPVLCGGAPAADTLLVSPIILYDYPQIAPESAGDFFDGTEIDEMLLLRVMTLSDEEKQQVAAGDPRGRGILDRASGVGEEQLMKVHGAIRGLRRATGEA